jgi:hypothetical protein
MCDHNLIQLNLILKSFCQLFCQLNLTWHSNLLGEKYIWQPSLTTQWPCTSFTTSFIMFYPCSLSNCFQVKLYNFSGSVKTICLYIKIFPNGVIGLDVKYLSSSSGTSKCNKHHFKCHNLATHGHPVVFLAQCCVLYKVKAFHSKWSSCAFKQIWSTQTPRGCS